MDFDFFKSWELTNSVKIGSLLMGKIIQSEYFCNHMKSSDEEFPVGSPDEGCIVSRYKLDNVSRHLFAKDLCNILADECSKSALNNMEDNEEKSIILNNKQVLLKLISLLIDSDSTHFAIS